MRDVKVFAIAAAAGLLIAGSLQAQSGIGQMKWVGVNGNWAPFSTDGGLHSFNIYTDPYRAQFHVATNYTGVLLPPSGSPFGPTSDIFCVDFDHYANTGTSNVWFTTLADGQANAGWFGTYTRSTSLQKYVEAAYLSHKIQTGGDKALYSAAIWQIMTGTPFMYKNGVWHDVWGAVNDATLAYEGGTTDVNLSEWAVVSEYKYDPNRNKILGDHQEFLTQVTPEPATLLLLGTGLVVMLMAAGAFRRPTV